MENVEVAPVTSIVDKTADQLFEVSPAYSDDQIVEITSDDETPEILKPVEKIVIILFFSSSDFSFFFLACFFSFDMFIFKIPKISQVSIDVFTSI